MTEQRDLSELGWQGAERGMKQALDHAERDAPGWGSRAYTALCAYMVAHRGQDFIAPAVRAWAETEYKLDPPPSTRSWGSVFRSASKRKLIEHSPARVLNYGDATTHTHPCTVWRAVLK